MTPRLKKTGWMFWGSFHGTHKGPFLFWDKKWGSMTAEKYTQRIVPLIKEEMGANPHLQLMQDNAPTHSARSTLEELSLAGILPMIWPSFSPDLNPIEHLWNLLKNFLQENYPESISGNQIPRQQLRQMMEAAWDSISVGDLRSLIESMPSRCKAVIDANGGHTRY